MIIYPRLWGEDKRNLTWSWSSETSAGFSPLTHTKNGVQRNIAGLFRFREIAGDFITVKLQCGLTPFQLQHCLGRMTVIRKSSGKHDTVSSLLRRFSLLKLLAVNYFSEQCYKTELESVDDLDSHMNTLIHIHSTLGAGAICQVY